jgi:hypothetical protein
VRFPLSSIKDVAGGAAIPLVEASGTSLLVSRLQLAHADLLDLLLLVVLNLLHDPRVECLGESWARLGLV